MQNYHPEQEKKKLGPKIRIGGAILTLAVGCSVYLWRYGTGGGLVFIKNTGAVIVGSWHDMFGILSQTKLIEEISLNHDQNLASSSITDTSSSILTPNQWGNVIGENEEASTQKSSKKKTDTISAVPDDNPEETIANSGDQEGTTDAGTETNVTASESPEGNIDQTVITTPIIVAKAQPTLCPFPSDNNPSREIILNEIAWMGSAPQDGETSAKAGEREWIELKNISANDIDASGWQILDSGGNIKVILADGANIPRGGFYLLVRDDASLPNAQPDAGYSGSLTNAGDALAVVDPDCVLSDFLDASSSWPAGNNTTKQTMERDSDGIGWHTSVAVGGTPKAENSVPLPVTPTSSASYLITVSMIGSGTGTVSSSPAGILCGFNCEENFDAGTKITFSETPNQGSQFKQWSGGCAGSGSCSFVVSSSISVTAEFDEIPTTLPTPVINEEQSSVATSSESTPDAPSTSTEPSSLDHLVIAAVEIAGASSSNDFVKIFNPTGATIDMSGWKLHKKSSTGADYSLRDIPNGISIAPNGYIVWANSEGGFSQSIGANISSTETLSADNSVALFDANGTVVDQVAWGTGTNQYVEAAPYPTDPMANQALTRKTISGAIIDTDNNANDFEMD